MKHNIGVMIMKKNRTLLFFILFAGILFYTPIYAVTMQTDLNGFRLWQFKSVVETSIGKPDKTLTTNNSNIEVYIIDDDCYMVFEYLKNYPENIFSIQITGFSEKNLPFMGLEIGDDISKVISLLGKPSSTEVIESPKVTSYDYEGCNYTIEIDNNGKLYSIKIFITKDMLTKSDNSFKSWDELKSAIVAKDINKIITLLRPDVEIYKNNKVVSIDKKHSDFISNRDSSFDDIFIGEHGSILEEINSSEPEAELRIHEKIGVGEVYKFYKGKILEEIVFYPYSGVDRVYEIKFRDN